MSDSMEVKVRAIEARIQHIRDEAFACVRDLLVRDESQFFLAERLPSLGTMILPVLREMIIKENDEALKVTMAWVGISAGDRAESVIALRNEVDKIGPKAPFAARLLGGHSVTEAAPNIIRALRGTSLGKPNDLIDYITALRELQSTIPQDVRERLAESKDSLVIKVLNKDFPSNG